MKSRVQSELFAVLPVQLADAIKAEFSDPVVADRWAKLPFESLWERVARVTGVTFVQQLMVREYGFGRPNFNHDAIAWLADRGHVHAIATTNYDEYIERAAGISTAAYGRLDADDPLAVQTALGNCRLVKLHGTLSIPTSLAFAFGQIAQGCSEATQQLLRRVFEPTPILFAGYGCNDWDFRGPLGRPINSVWASRRDRWEEIEERCRFLAAGHREVALWRHSLAGEPGESVFVQLATHFGWPKPVAPAQVAGEKSADEPLFPAGVIGVADRVEILAEILDSLAIRGASRLFSRCARLPHCRNKRDNRIASLAALGHDMDMRAMRRRGVLLSRCRLHPSERRIVMAKLAFAELIGGWPVQGLVRTLHLWWQLGLWWDRELPAGRVDDVRRVRMDGERWVDSRHIVAHNFIRLAWFHHPGAAGKFARLVRPLGVRWILIRMATRILERNEAQVRDFGDLPRIAQQAREKAHCLCLLRKHDEALAAVKLAEDAYGWGHWYQWQANALRTRGWIWLWSDRRAMGLECPEERAREAFQRAFLLGQEQVTRKGEMTEDRIKAFLELKRLSFLQGIEFMEKQELEADLAIVAVRDAGSWERYRQLSAARLQTREPIG